MIEEAQLARRICAGESELFRHLIRNFQDPVMSIAISIVKDEYIAEEVVQDAFIKVYQNLGSFDHRSKLSTWLYRIVTNEALMRLRKMKVDRISFPDNIPDTDMEEDSLKALESKEMQKIISQTINQLAPNECLSLHLYYLQEESLKEVCEITGWSMSNAKTILHRARKKLAHLLTKQINQQ